MDDGTKRFYVEVGFYVWADSQEAAETIALGVCDRASAEVVKTERVD